MATRTVKKSIVIPDLEIETFTLKLVGITPLIVHAWSEKAKRMMLDKQTKKASAGKEIRRPHVEFANSLYWLSDKPDIENLTDEEAREVIEKAIPNAKFGFKTIAFKTAAIDAGYQQGVLDKKTTARGAFHTVGEFAVINGTPHIREDMVRIGQGTADLRYRAEFPVWSTKLAISYNPKSMSIEQIINLFKHGGFANGVGEQRPAKDGDYGRFDVALGEQD